MVKKYETKRNTFIDDINNNKKFKVPGVGKYNLEPTNEKIKERLLKLESRKIKVSLKDNIFCDY